MKTILMATIVTLVCSTSALARTWHIESDGTGDAPTIGAGVDSASAGDTVLVICGTYYEDNIRVRNGIVLASETGGAECARIVGDRHGSVLLCSECDSTTLIQGFTISGGGADFGGGAWISSSAMTVANCAFVDNGGVHGGGVYCVGEVRFVDCLFSDNYGGVGSAVFCDGAPFVTPFSSFRSCTFEGNRADYDGTFYCNHTSPRLVNCTFYGNSARLAGGGVYCWESASPVLENTIISGSGSGGAIYCDAESDAHLYCCDIYGNAGGDWVGCIADQSGTNGNFSACPSFCNAEGGDFHLCDESPCLPGHNPMGDDCGLVGAWDQGCGCGSSSTQPTSWGSLKAVYR